MNKKEIKTKIAELLSAGTQKAEVFNQLSGQGVKDSQLAYLIAAHPDPERCETHSGKVNVLITIMFIQAVVAFVIGYAIGAKIGPNAKWILGIFVAAIPLLFAWGFYANRVGSYNVYLVLSIIQLPKSLEGFTSSPIASSIGIAIGIGLMAYVWYVREKLFPDFFLTTPKKVKGEYVFVN